MDTSLRWLYELEAQYIKERGGVLWSMSDWHNEPGDIALPVNMLSSLTIDINNASRYKFVDTSQELKEIISNFYHEEFSFCMPESKIAFCHNGTTSLHLVARSLMSEGLRRALVITPGYFSLLSSLDQCGVTVVYHHLDLYSELCIDVDQILKVANDQMVEAIFVTNPIFSTGKVVPDAVMDALTHYSETKGVTLVIDETLAGLPWQRLDKEPYLSSSIRRAINSTKSIYIYSLSKALFINGIKHAIVLGSKEIVTLIERMADHTVGGLVIHQIELAKQIYNQRNCQEVCVATRNNVARFVNSFNLCKAILSDTDLRITCAESGFHCVVYAPNRHSNSNKHAREIVTRIMFEHGVTALPLAHFGFPPAGPIGFRINLSKRPGMLQSTLRLLAKTVQENANFFN